MGIYLAPEPTAELLFHQLGPVLNLKRLGMDQVKDIIDPEWPSECRLFDNARGGSHAKQLCSGQRRHESPYQMQSVPLLDATYTRRGVAPRSQKPPCSGNRTTPLIHNAPTVYDPIRLGGTGHP